jgi:hypothetical protein
VCLALLKNPSFKKNCPAGGFECYGVVSPAMPSLAAYNIAGMSNQSPKQEKGSRPRKRWHRFSATDIGTFLVLYGLGSLVCRFDISRHHSLSDEY